MDQAPVAAIETWPIGRPRDYERNARTHSPEQIDQLRGSFREFGQVWPVLVREDGTIIAGHGRIEAARLEGFTEIQVIVARGWTEQQCRAFTLLDNRVPLNAGWNDELLRIEVGELRALGVDLGSLGFASSEIEILLGDIGGAGDPDDVPTVPANPVSRAGDLWIMGRHRLICGDCRDAATVARLCDGRAINLAFTSPPYAEQRNYDEASGFKPIHPDQYVAWFESVAANVAAHLADDGSWFVNIKPHAEGLDTSLYVFDLILAHVRRWGWHFATEFCWERSGVPKWVKQRFKNQFEPIYQFARNHWKMRPEAVRHFSGSVPMMAGGPAGSISFGNIKKRPHGSRGNQGRLQGLVLADGTSGNIPGEYVGPGLAYPGNRLPTFSHTHDATGHAAAFPVGLPEFFCNAYTDAGDVVFDPFCGSGSTLIAAETTKRDGLATEISPAYCDVIVERWEKFSGGRAMLGGTPFAEIRAARLTTSR
jgi:DNA modification methylase